MKQTSIFLLMFCYHLIIGQNVGIGLLNPVERLDVDGNIKTNGEIKPNGVSGQAKQVLTSNGNGTMQWENMSSNENGGGSGAGPWSNWCDDNVNEYQPVGNNDGKPQDYFGTSVSISGEYAIVGAYADDEAYINNGSATIYKRNHGNGMWEPKSMVINPGNAATDLFGISVCISGDYAIVGAMTDDEGFPNQGSATIFKRSPNSEEWVSQGKLLNPDPAENDLFGYSVSISGDFAIIGSYNDNEGIPTQGSATIFKRNSSLNIWEPQVKLTNSNPAENDFFGYSVSISGDYAIIGAYNDEEEFLHQGSATIFKRNNDSEVWESQGKLLNINPEANDGFGWSVSIINDYAIVGSISDNEGYQIQGSATIFKKNSMNGNWEHQTKLVSPEPGEFDYFGSSVSISGEYAVVGANYDDAGNGSATIFRRHGSIWKTVQKIKDPSVAANDFFGSSVGIDGKTRRFLIGAPNVQGGMGMVSFGKVK